MASRLSRFFEYPRLYVLFAGIYFRRVLEYRTDFFLGFGTHLVRSATGLLLVWTLINRVQVFRGWSSAEVMLIFGLSVTTTALSNIISVSVSNLGRSYILTGDLDRLLLRPRNTLFQLLAGHINEMAVGQLVSGIAALAWAFQRMPGFLTPVHILWLSAAVICGTIIYFSIILLSVSICFWFELEWGVLEITETLGTLAQYPLDIYNTAIRFLLTWIIPFGFTAFLPAAAVLRSGDYQVYYYLLPVFTLVIFGAAYIVWKTGLRRYVGAGH